MRIPRRAIPAQPLTHLWERHKELARLVVAGERPIDIARTLSMTPCRVSIIMNSPAFKQYVDSLRERVEEGLVDIRKEINKGAQVGVSFLLKLMTDARNEEQPITTTEKFKAGLAKDFLDREGHGRVQKVQQTNTMVILNAAKIEELKQKRQAQLDASRMVLIN